MTEEKKPVDFDDVANFLDTIPTESEEIPVPSPVPSTGSEITKEEGKTAPIKKTEKRAKQPAKPVKPRSEEKSKEGESVKVSGTQFKLIEQGLQKSMGELRVLVEKTANETKVFFNEMQTHGSGPTKDQISEIIARMEQQQKSQEEIRSELKKQESLHQEAINKADLEEKLIAELNEKIELLSGNLQRPATSTEALPKADVIDPEALRQAIIDQYVKWYKPRVKKNPDDPWYGAEGSRVAAAIYVRGVAGKPVVPEVIMQMVRTMEGEGLLSRIDVKQHKYLKKQKGRLLPTSLALEKYGYPKLKDTLPALLPSREESDIPTYERNN